MQKTVLSFLLHFPIGIGSYEHHAKYHGVFPFLGVKKTHPDILRGGQLENAIKSGGTVFFADITWTK